MQSVYQYIAVNSNSLQTVGYLSQLLTVLASGISMLRSPLIRNCPTRWYLLPGRAPSRSVVKDSRYYLELAKERGIRLPGGFKYGEKPLLPGERRVIPFADRVMTWGLWFSLFLFYFLAYIKPPTSWDVQVDVEAVQLYEKLLTEAGIEDLTIEEEY